ncbi:hypothetical protein A6770_22010 [Nostoc minutum NIES-26]|uniref:tRNA nuclease CdiA C-terminal domain-containing protein n=1 Tax=Nostoc minutum NIES-26 TaxID=1844469 RepID=A0A367R0F5_9NOSO|nr:hypothetical protein A6770_22010 [Nostoc minutum NIES-26]
MLILEEIVALAIAHGQAKALEMLSKSWFGKQLGQARLAQWLNQQLKARGEAITPDGQRMPIQGETPQRQQPMRMQGASGGNVIKNKLDQHEFAFAQEIVNEKGGQFIGQTERNLPGIDGTLNGVPVSLKETQGGLAAILRHASKAESQAIKAGYKGVDLYINAPNVDKATLLDFIRNGPLKNIPNQGTISLINIKKSDS